jgi:TetR/AcrR family transcriptional regulator, cholesterol catabolism regulator
VVHPWATEVARSPGPRLPGSRAARRERIVRTAFDLLVESDYDAIQMRDIAESSEVALATLYRYFPSKEQLFAAVQLEWVERLHRRVAQRPLRGGSNLDRLLDVIHRSILAFRKKPQFYRVLLLLEATKDPIARDLYESMQQATTATYLEALVGIDQDTAEGLLTAALAILGAEMRAWALGKRSLEEAENNIEESLRLLFTYRDEAASTAGRTA